MAPTPGRRAVGDPRRATTTKTEREAAARTAVDELHAASQRAALAGSGIVEEGWQEKVDTAGKQIEATLAWRDTTAKTSSTARLLIVADDAHVTSVTGECFAADDADAKQVAACKRALATLDPGIDAAEAGRARARPDGNPAVPTPPGAARFGPRARPHERWHHARRCRR